MTRNPLYGRPEAARVLADAPPGGGPASGGDGSLKILSRYVGNTEPVTDTITEWATDPGTGARYQRPLDLSPVGTTVHFMRMDSQTGTIVVDASATILQTTDPTTFGSVRYDPQPLEVAAPIDSTCWWRVTLNGVIQDTPEWVERIIAHGVAAPTTEALSQVCAPWATNADVLRYNGAGIDERDYSLQLAEASELLWALSGRRFTGTCTITVRPAQTGACPCFQTLSRGHLIYPPSWMWVGGLWCAEGEQLQVGCGVTPTVRLAGHATRIVNVKLSGVAVDPATYRLDRNEYLVRLTDPATGQNPGWPLCQNMALPDDAPGTFSVTYEYGVAPPLAGVRAAAQLAYQLWLADNAEQACALPAGWTSVSRQGITVSRAQIEKLASQGSGITGIDAFLASVNPYGLTQPSVVYSRDVSPYPFATG